MADVKTLERRVASGDVIILDGAVGTQLQALGVPIVREAWSAVALHTHPDTVRYMHERYVKMGCDIITTNTYSAARHCFEPLGLGDSTRELNLRAVVLAQEARDRVKTDHPVYIAGAVSNYGLLAGSEWRVGPNRMLMGEYYRETSDEQAKANLREQAEILAESGIDMFLAESTGGIEQRKWVTEACVATGLPTWVGFKCHMADGKVKTGYSEDSDFGDAIDQIMPIAKGPTVLSVFHSPIDATNASLPIVRQHWKGPVGVYPDAHRTDYVSRRGDPAHKNETSVEEFVAQCRKWVDSGVQVIGACCGFGFEYIEPLRSALPKRIPAKAA